MLSRTSVNLSIDRAPQKDRTPSSDRAITPATCRAEVSRLQHSRNIRIAGHFSAHGMPDLPCVVPSACGPTLDEGRTPRLQGRDRLRGKPSPFRAKTAQTYGPAALTGSRVHDLQCLCFHWRMCEGASRQYQRGRQSGRWDGIHTLLWSISVSSTQATARSAASVNCSHCAIHRPRRRWYSGAIA